jgi:hypothetical protein
MPRKDTEIEAAISAASAAKDANPRLRGSKAAAQFGAPYQRLMAHRWGRPKSSSRGGYNKKLSAPQDAALKEYLMMLFATGFQARKEIKEDIEEERRVVNMREQTTLEKALESKV